MKLSIETEINESLSFVDVKIFWENKKFLISVFKKDMFSGICTNFISFIPVEFNFGLVNRLLNPCFDLHFDSLKFHHEVNKLNKLFSLNAYLQNFIDKCIQNLLSKMFIQTPQIATVPKK